MTRSNHMYSSEDPMLLMARRNRALGQRFAGIVVVVGILAITVHTAWQQPSGSNSGVIDAGNDHSVPGTPNEAALDTQMRVNPSAIMFDSSNVRG